MFPKQVNEVLTQPCVPPRGWLAWKLPAALSTDDNHPGLTRDVWRLPVCPTAKLQHDQRWKKCNLFVQLIGLKNKSMNQLVITNGFPGANRLVGN